MLRVHDQCGEKNASWLQLPEHEIVSLYTVDKWTLSEIARKFDTDNETIKRRLVRHQVALRSFNESTSLGIRRHIESRRRAFQGKNNPAYIHGKKVGQKANRRVYLEIAKNNFEWKCSKCTKIPQDHEMDLIVHHIDHNNTNNSIDNLMILCQSCHCFIHGLPAHNKGWRVNL